MGTETSISFELYIPKLNEAGFQITVTKEKSLEDQIILVCKAAYWDTCRQYLPKIPTINQEWNSGLQRNLITNVSAKARTQVKFTTVFFLSNRFTE